MRVRDVLGKRITAVIQERVTDNTGASRVVVDTLILEDGTRLTTEIIHTESVMGVEPTVTVQKPERRKRT